MMGDLNARIGSINIVRGNIFAAQLIEFLKRIFQDLEGLLTSRKRLAV